MLGFGRRKETAGGSKRVGWVKRLGWYFDSLVILGIGVGGFMLLQIFAPRPQLEEPPSRVAVVDVVPAKIESGPLRIRGHGVVRPRAEITLAAQVSGRIVEVSPQFVSGGQFTKGDVLVQIDPRIYEANLKQAEANKRAAEASLAFILQQIKRTEPLAKKGFAAKEKFDQLLSQRDEAEATVLQNEARIDEAKINLEHSTVVAQFDGRVESENTDVGAYVNVGQQLGTIFVTDAMEITIQLSDDEAFLLPDMWSQNVEAQFDSLDATVTTTYGTGKWVWDGYVHRAEATIDQGTRTVDVVVRVDDPFRRGQHVVKKDSSTRPVGTPPPLLSGMYATVEMEGISLNRFVTIPREALRDNDTVWIVENDNTLRELDVAVIQKRGDRATIRSPVLDDGTLIITSALTVMNDGMQIRVLNTLDMDALSQLPQPQSLTQ